MTVNDCFRQVLDDGIDLQDALAELKSRYGGGVLCVVGHFARCTEEMTQEEFLDRLALAMRGAGSAVRSAVFLALFDVAVAMMRGLQTNADELANRLGIEADLIVDVAMRLGCSSQSSADFTEEEIERMLAGLQARAGKR